MKDQHLIEQAKKHLHALCVEIPNRRVGSPENKKAVEYTAAALRTFGFQLETPQFECIDWAEQGASLVVAEQSFRVFPSPYSLGCQVTAELVSAETLTELEALDAAGKLLLLRGELTKEQLMPKGYPFYYPDHHRQLHQLLESKRPAAIIAATARNPQLAGGLYPFPSIEDGNFHIPSVYMTDKEGELLLQHNQQTAHLTSNAQRIPSTGNIVVGCKGRSQAPKIVVMAHIDTKPNTPGAIDNAAGVIVLLLLAELLKEYDERLGIEIFIVNGEDYYGANGEILYLAQNKHTLKDILLAVNIDAAGYYQGRSEYSLYVCPAETTRAVQQAFSQFSGIGEGPQWYQSDHSVFLQQGVPAMAITSETFIELSTNITHTPEDRPEIVDPVKVAEIAQALQMLITSQLT